MAKVWIPADRFLDLLDRCNVTNDELDGAGIRRMSELRTGRQEALSLDVADRILTGLGLSEMFSVRKEDGGLEDLYTEAVVFTPAWVTESKEQLAVAREKRRVVKRKSKFCECGTPIKNSSTMCVPCYRESVRGRNTKLCECGTPITTRSMTCIPCYRESVRNQESKEKRRAAARVYYRSWSRQKGRRCECGTPIMDSSSSCRPCYLAAKPKPEHGTRSCYVTGCRCLACTRADSDYARDYKRRRRAAYLEAQAAA